jgi:hypothetical protein
VRPRAERGVFWCYLRVGRNKLPLPTADEVRTVKNGQQRATVTVTELYDRLRAHEFATQLSDHRTDAALCTQVTFGFRLSEVVLTPGRRGGKFGPRFPDTEAAAVDTDITMSFYHKVRVVNYSLLPLLELAE